MADAERLRSDVLDMYEALHRTDLAPSVVRVCKALVEAGRIPGDVLQELRPEQPAPLFRPCINKDGSTDTFHVRPATVDGIPVEEALIDVQRGPDHTAMLSAAGRVWCRGSNSHGELGTGDTMNRNCAVQAQLPWKAEAIAVAQGCTLALRRGGTAVCSWGDARALGRTGGGAQPAEVTGLPSGDPVRLLRGSGRGALVITRGDQAYSWADGGLPQRVAALSGMGVRQLAFHTPTSFVMETSGRCGARLLLRDSFGPGKDFAELRPAAGSITFPLRSLAVDCEALVAADAVGRVWYKWIEHTAPGWVLRCALDGRQRAVRVAIPASFAFYALTEGGFLLCMNYDSRSPQMVRCHDYNDGGPQDCQGLLPCSGWDEQEGTMLLRDASGGKKRLSLFARIAVILNLPSDPVRAVILPDVVHECYITGPPDNPFG